MSDSISVPNHLLTQLEFNPDTNKQPLLRFQLEPHTTALLPLCYSTEVLSIPRREIVPIFFMPAWVTGVYNLRGEILWVVDLGHLLGLMPHHPQTTTSATLTTIVLNGASSINGASSSSTNLKTRNLLLGCIVNQLEAIEYCSVDEIRSPSATTAATLTPLPFTQGYWSKSDHELLAVLDVGAIMAAMPKPEF